MIDWTKSMSQTYEYCVVDPLTWKDKYFLRNVRSSTIDWDLDSETFGSSKIDMDELIDECYIRTYLVCVQNGVRERFSLGTFLYQSPSSKFDGYVSTSSIDGYTPLIELKEDMPDIGYYLPKGDNIMSSVYRLAREHLRAPIFEVTSDEKLLHDFVAETDDTWLSYLTSLLQNTKYQFGLDELTRIIFTPIQNIEQLQPTYTYDDSNSSILLPELDLKSDLYGVPNVVEVVYSSSYGYFYSKIVNDDINSPISTINRGRIIKYRDTNPELSGIPTQEQVDEYAKRLMRSLTTLENTITYSHGYCGTRVGDCVRLNYERAGIRNVKAKIVNQNISCTLGCPVSETSIFTTNLWEG